MIHNYRWRLGLADGEAKYDDLEKRLAEAPVITVPTITLEGDANGAPHPDPSAYAGKFSGKYLHRLITGGIGHNLPQEAPQAFAQADHRRRQVLTKRGKNRAMSQTTNVIYTAKTHTTGGRENGVSRSSDGQLEVKLAPPGPKRIGTNPEQMFAGGWSACFEGALGLAAHRKKIKLPPDVAIDAEVDLHLDDGEYFLECPPQHLDSRHRTGRRPKSGRGRGAHLSLLEGDTRQYRGNVQLGLNPEHHAVRGDRAFG